MRRVFLEWRSWRAIWSARIGPVYCARTCRRPCCGRCTPALDEIRTLFGRGNAHHERVEAVPGDIEAPGLGLGRRDSEALAEQVTDVVHCAATVFLSLPLEVAHRSKRREALAVAAPEVGGRRALGLCACALGAAARVGRCGAGGHPPPKSARLSEFLRTLEVRGGEDGEAAPRSLARSRSSGQASLSANGQAVQRVIQYFFYAPLRAFALGKLPAVPARLSSPVDVVPVDYVADAVFELASREGDEDETYHLVAGGGRRRSGA